MNDNYKTQFDTSFSKTYELKPVETYKIIRNCGGCGCKNTYSNTEKIRLNANGKQLDVWLIYQCQNCKHTYNLPIYSRVNINSFDVTEYNKLLNNDINTIFQYGLDRNLFIQNRLNIIEPDYILTEVTECTKEKTIRIRNPYHLHIRYDVLLALCLKTTRTKIKKDLETGWLSISNVTDKEFNFEINIV